jgi:type II secretory pathway component GspD/PulD (secretin)
LPKSKKSSGSWNPAGKKGAKEETRVVRLKAALAAEIAGLVEKSLNAQAQQVRVMVDARSNSLVLTGDSTAVEAASQVIAQLDTRSDVQPREMRIIELKQGEASALAPLATSLSVEMIKDQRGPEYTPQSKIVPDATANRLIVSGPRDEIKMVATVVEQLDQAPEASGGARVFKLVNADAAQVVGVVSNAMLKFDARNQPLRRVTVSLDRESNSIVVSGSRNDLKDAEAIIQRLDNEGDEPNAGPVASRTRELKIIEVRSEDVDGLAALASRVFTAQNAGRTITNLVSITPEPNSKRLIVLAPAHILTQVEAVVASLDSKPEQGARELYPIELKGASANELLPHRHPHLQRTNPGPLRQTSQPLCRCGGHAAHGLWQSRASGGRSANRGSHRGATAFAARTKVFELGKLAEVTRVLPLAQQLYKDQVASNPQGGAPDAQFISDNKTGRLIVSARADQLGRIEGIITSLQGGAATNQPGRETRSFEVGSAADVQRLQPLVQQLYQDQWKEKSESDPADAQILSDTKTGRLIVTGKPEHLKQIESILTQLGTGAAKPRSDVRDTRIIDLSTASAVELATTVRTLYLEQAKSRFGAQTPDTLITPDAGGNRLILAGETNELEVIEDIVRKLDKVSAQSSTARVFKLKSAEPNKVAEILTSALVRYDAYGRPQKRASVSVDAKSRTLIVTGDPKELQGVSVIIEQLDTSLGAQAERKMKVITLKQGRASEVLVKVRQLYTDHLTAQPELSTTDVLMMEDAASNQLILAGSDAQLSLLEKIVNNLQEAGNNQAARETRSFEIGNADEIARVQPLVQQLYTEQWKDKAPGDPADAQLLADPRTAASSSRPGRRT